MDLPFRQPVPTCPSAGTYTYFFDPGRIGEIWARLTERYGPPRDIVAFATIELESPEFLLRAPASGNPITVVRKRRCTNADIDVLHDLFAFRRSAR